MTLKRTVAATVLASFVAGLVPTLSFAAEGTPATVPARPSDATAAGLREAGRKAVAMFVKDDARRASLAVPASPRTSRRAQSNSGGGSKVLPIVLTLVGVAASAGVTYYAVKEMKKTTPTTPQ